MLDPVTFFRRVHGFDAYPWQVDLLRSTERRILTLKGRQVGFSAAVGTLAAYLAWTKPGALVLLTARGMRGSNELLRSASLAARALGVLPVEEESSVRLSFENGARVISVPGATPDGFRGFSRPDLVAVDEAGYVEENVHAVISPMFASAPRGRFIVGGTPNGKGGWFYREWEEGRDWRRFRVPSDTIPTISRAFLERERESLGESWFEQEYACSFKTREGQAIPDEILDKMFRAGVSDVQVLRDAEWTVEPARPIDVRAIPRVPDAAPVDLTLRPTWGEPGGLGPVEDEVGLVKVRR